MFGLGCGIQAALKLLRALPLMFKKPRAIFDALKHSDNLKLGAFLGSYVAAFKVKCESIQRLFW